MRVYQHGILVTVNEQFDVIRDGSLAVEGTKIVYAGPYRAFSGEEEIDVRGHMILPGFVNGHCHMPMVLFRGYADDMDLHSWLNDRIFPMESKHTDLTQYHGALLAALELIRTGTTTVNDMYYDGTIIGRALREAGLSGIVSTCLLSTDERLAYKEELALRTWEMFRDDPDISTAVAPHAEYTCKLEDLERFARFAYETAQPIHVHLSETRSEHEGCIGRYGMTPVRLFEKLGLLKVPAFLAHCVWVTEEDMDIIHENGAAVLHNPCSNLKLASGVAPIPRMLEKGLKIAVSTDGASSNNTLDMWEEMRIEALIQKGVRYDPKVMDARTSLYLATRGAALALGYQDRGSLEPGLRADFTVVRMDEPSMAIETDIIHLIVYSGNSRDIVTTVSGGKVLYDHGEYKTLDKERIFREAREDFEKVFK